MNMKNETCSYISLSIKFIENGYYKYILRIIINY